MEAAGRQTNLSLHQGELPLQVDRKGQPIRINLRRWKQISGEEAENWGGLRRGGGGVERGGDPGGRPRSCSRGRPPGSPQRRARPSLVVARAALVCSMPDHSLAPPQRGRPQGSPLRSTPLPPLRIPPPLACLFPTLLFPPP